VKLTAQYLHTLLCWQDKQLVILQEVTQAPPDEERNPLLQLLQKF
jgi:hypothetical protein